MENKISVIDDMRRDARSSVQNRKTIAALATLGLIDFSLISLFQIGYIKKLPDLPGKIFDSEKVNSSNDAVLLGLPDGVIGLCAYAATMLLATAGSRKSKYSGYFDVLLGAFVIGQAAGGAHYLYNMVKVQKKVCLYCVAGAAINFASIKPLLSLYKHRKEETKAF